ncbi:hypothetical protein ACRHM7_13125 [Chromohalobacter israelensis]|uniref:hypothetical protein n=1 Tax=Chromohalobacter israelensis TaxID=141390 RepID=UPI003D79A804
MLFFLAVAIPASFYFGVNTLTSVAPGSLSFSRGLIKGNVDICEVSAERIRIQGWAFVPGVDTNTLVRIFVENEEGELFEIEARGISRPDVDARFDIGYRNSLVGFHASSSLPPANAKGHWRVLVIKPDAANNLHGEYYECH